MSKRLRSFLISLLVGALLCAMVIFINRDQGYGLLRLPSGSRKCKNAAAGRGHRHAVTLRSAQSLQGLQRAIIR